VIAQHGADITCVDIIDPRQTYFEIDVTDGMALLDDLPKLTVVRKVAQVKILQAVFGKRASSSSVVGRKRVRSLPVPFPRPTGTTSAGSTSRWILSLWWASNPADAVRACARLPRVKALVLAGALMGGDIEQAVLVKSAPRTYRWRV